MEKTTFWLNFYDLCVRFDVKPSAVCKAIGLSPNTASNWKNLGTVPNHKVIHNLAEYFNCAESYFFLTPGQQEVSADASAQLKKALDLVSQVPEEKLQRVIDFVSGILS